MIVSKNSILEIFKKMHIDLSNVPQKNSLWVEAFTSIGIEVENIIINDLNPNDYAVVKLLKVENHPNSDHLHICDVYDGYKNHQIICGASNVYEGMYTIMAKIGTIVPEGYKIEPRKLRGIESFGMLCSLSELFPALRNYLTTIDNNGIVDLKIQGNKAINFELKENAENWIDYLMLNDTIFELSLATNAGYLNGLIPISIALLAYWNINYSLQSNEIIKNNIKNTDLIDDLGFITFKNKSIDEYYLRMFLAHNFIKANFFANQVALLFSHYFGFNFMAIKDLSFSTLEVKNLTETKKVTFNSKDYELKKDTEVLLADNKILGIPGIIVSDDFVVSNNEDEFFILFSSTNWQNSLRLNNELNLNSFLSKLATKQTSFYFFNNYLSHFFDWIDRNKIKVINHKLSQDKFISLKAKNLINKLATNSDLDLSKILHQLFLLQIRYDEQKEGFITPSYRIDLVNDNDLVEEALRMINVNSLNPEPISSFIIQDQDTFMYDLINKIRNYLISLGFWETKTYKLISKREFENTFIPNYNSEKQIITNPISSEKEVIKHSFLNSLINVLQFNLNQKNYSLQNIFEINNLYWENNVDTNNILGILISRDIAVDYKYINVNLNFNLIFDLINNLLLTANNKHINCSFEEDSSLNSNFNKLFKINFNEQYIGFVGNLKKNLDKNILENSKDLFYVELNIDKFSLMSDLKKEFIKYSELPNITRDLNISINKDIDFSIELERIRKELMQKFELIKELNVKSIFINKENEKIITLNYILKPEKNLLKNEIDSIDQEVKKFINKLINN